MFQISKAMIRKLATNDTVYSRGLRYYNNHAIHNVTWSKTNKQYRALVQGKSEYVVTIQMNEDNEDFTYHCNCPAACKYEGACKHVVATMLFIADYMRRTEIDVPDNPEEKNIYNILEYFNKSVNMKTVGEIFHIKVQIAIPTLLKNNIGKAFISLQSGSNKLYKIQSLKKFLSDYYKKENISLGKDFNFVVGESRFDENSKRILNYLLEIFEIQESLGKVYYSNLFSKSQMTMTKNMLLKLLELIGSDTFDLELYNKHYEDIRFLEKNPRIRYEIRAIEDSILLEYISEDTVLPLADTGELLFFHRTIYHPNDEFIRNYIPFYHCLGKDKEPLDFKGENKNKFLESVLPKLYETMSIDIPEDMKEQYIKADLKVSIYLDRYKSGLRADLKFRYDNYEFNPLNYQSEETVIVVRQIEKENEVFEYLDKLLFEQNKDFYIMKEESSIYDFLSTFVHEMSQLFEVYYSDSFRSIQINKPSRLTTKLSLSNQNNLLEMEFEYDEVPKDELKDLFRSFRLKKNYHRLKNGNFINLDDSNLEQIAEIVTYLNTSLKDIKDDKLVLPKNSAFYLENVLAEDENIIVTKNKEFNKMILQILKPEGLLYPVPDSINAELRPYQVTGYRWLKTLAENQLGGILADDMGLGKTLQTIVYIVSSKLEGKGPFFIVCPSSLVYNWQDEFENFAPDITTAIVNGTPEERKACIDNYKNIDVLITSYPLIRRDLEVYSNILFDTMFIDEAQFIKNANSLNAKAVKKIEAIHKFALTGTPIENTLSELWSIFDYVMPYYLLSHTKFMNQYEKPIVKEESTEALANLSKHIQPFILRRMKKDVLQELPEKVENKMIVELTESQKKVYLSYLDEIKGEIGTDISENGMEKSRFKILAALTRLRQICCHPGTFIDNYKGGSGKVELLMEILPSLIEGGHRMLIFSQFTSMLSILKNELEAVGISYFYLEGATPLEVRSENVKAFNNGENSVFLISLKAGGTGLNLTGADTVIHFDPWWNPAVEDQATDRVYRIGQTNSVQVIKLITKGTIEEKIFKLQKKKKELSDSVIEAKEVFINQLTKEELQDIFNL